MAKKVRSARGEILDFDLLKIKAQISKAPKSIDVKKREDFIDKKLRRRVRKIKKKVTESMPIDVDANITDNTDTDTTEK